MKVARNALYNLAGFLIPITVSLVSVPLYVHHLGEARYGVLVLVWLITGFLFALDLGIGMAIRFEIARRAEAAPEDRAEVFWTAALLSAAFGLVGAVVMYGAAYYIFGSMIELPDSLRRETLAVVPWIAASVPLGVFEGVMTGSLIGQEKFLAANMCRIVGSTIGQFLPLGAVLLIGPTLGAAVPASMVGKLLLVALLSVTAFRAIKAGWRPRYTASLARNLLSYGLWSSAGSFGRQILTFSDRFVIGAIVGAASVALYAVPINLMQRAQGIPRALIEAIFPRVAKAVGDDFHHIAKRALSSNFALGTVMTVGALVTITPFIQWWINPTFAARVGTVAPLSTLTILATSAFQVPSMILRACGKPRVTTTTLLLEVVPFLLVLYVCTLHFGLVGAVSVVIARGFIDGALLSWQSSGLASYLSYLAQSLAIVAVAGIVVWLLPHLTPVSIAARLGVIGLSSLWALWISPDIVKLLRTVAGKLRGRRQGASA